MLRKREYTKKEVSQLRAIGGDPTFKAELVNLLEEFRQGDKVKDFLAEAILDYLPLHRATSVTWLIYELCNAFNDHELDRDFLSELVVEVEELVEAIEKIIANYK